MSIYPVDVRAKPVRRSQPPVGVREQKVPAWACDWLTMSGSQGDFYSGFTPQEATRMMPLSHPEVLQGLLAA